MTVLCVEFSRAVSIQLSYLSGSKSAKYSTIVEVKLTYSQWLELFWVPVLKIRVSGVQFPPWPPLLTLSERHQSAIVCAFHSLGTCFCYRWGSDFLTTNCPGNGARAHGVRYNLPLSVDIKTCGIAGRRGTMTLSARLWNSFRETCSGRTMARESVSQNAQSRPRSIINFSAMPSVNRAAPVISTPNKALKFRPGSSMALVVISTRWPCARRDDSESTPRTQPRV